MRTLPASVQEAAHGRASAAAAIPVRTDPGRGEKRGVGRIDYAGYLFVGYGRHDASAKALADQLHDQV